MSDQATITVFGTGWCPDCWRAKKILEAQQVAYRWINIDEDAGAAARVRELNHGLRSVPTIVFGDGTVLVEPSNSQLLQVLFALKDK